MTFDGSNVNLFIAFIGGMITFFASCLLPLVPTYIAYLTGLTLKAEVSKKEIIINSALFTFGFIVVFMIFGLTANKLGNTFAQNRVLLQKIGGVFFIIIGMFMLNVIKPAFLYRERKIDLRSYFTKWQKINSFIIGLTFGFAWTPCIGPVLSVILFWASQAQTALKGTLLLLFYGLGLGIPFMVIGAFFDQLVPKLKKAKRISLILSKLSGIIILVVGALLLIGRMHYISIIILKLFSLDSHSV